MISGKTAFQGYRRENGRVGVRNHVLILPVDDLSNAAAEAVANNVKGALAIPHPYGRLQFGADLELHFRTLIGAGANPNVAAVVVICIEEGWAKRVVEGIAKTGKPVTGFGIELHGGQHLTRRQALADIKRERGVQSREWLVQVFTRGDILTEPAEVCADLARTLAAARAAPTVSTDSARGAPARSQRQGAGREGAGMTAAPACPARAAAARARSWSPRPSTSPGSSSTRSTAATTRPRSRTRRSPARLLLAAPRSRATGRRPAAP